MKHTLVPEFRILSEGEKEEVLRRFSTREENLPKIHSSDPVVKKIGAKAGELLEIKRKSEVAGQSIYYRLVFET